MTFDTVHREKARLICHVKCLDFRTEVLNSLSGRHACVCVVFTRASPAVRVCVFVLPPRGFETNQGVRAAGAFTAASISSQIRPERGAK